MRDKSLFRLIWFGCLSVCLPIIISGIVYYQYSMNNGILQVKENTKMALQMIEQYVEKIMNEIENDSIQLSLDQNVIHSFMLTDINTDYDIQRDILNKITLQKSKNEFIREIFYYHRDAGFVLSTELGYQKLSDFKYTTDLEILESGKLFGKWIYLPIGTNSGYISFALRLPALSSGIGQGILLIEVDARHLNNYLSNFSFLTRGQQIIVLDHNNQYLFKSKNRSDTISHKVLQHLDNNIQSDNSLIIKDLNENNLYSYRLSTTGKKYISAIQYETIINELTWIRWVTLTAVIVLIAIGILLTIFTLKRAYMPIRKLVDYLNNETTTLEHLWSKSVPPLKERLLQQWLGGNYITSNTLIEECQQYGIPLDRNYIVLIVKSNNLISKSSFRPEDHSIKTFAILNIMNELLDEKPASGIVLHDHLGHGTAIIHFDRKTDPSDIMEIAMQYAFEIKQSIEHYLKLQTSIGIGRIYPHIADIRLSYQEASLSLQYRMFEDNSILYVDNLTNDSNAAKFVYPTVYEKQIIEFLNTGHIEHAADSLCKFTDTLKNCGSIHLISQSYHLLLTRILISIEKNGGSITEMLHYEVIDQLKSKETIEEITQWFTQTLFPLYVTISDSNYYSSGSVVVEKIKQYIIDNISSDISLSECADKFHIAYTYLSRLFKEEVGVSFLDYLTQIKIHTAQKLLIETDTSIGNIAEQVGYSQRTFNRVFKQQVGKSPREFRNSHY